MIPRILPIIEQGILSHRTKGVGQLRGASALSVTPAPLQPTAP